MSVALLDAASLDSALIDWAQRHLGFDRRALRMERLRSAAGREVERLGWPVFIEALRQGEPGLDAALITAATVGETYFYRQREHFELLSKLPFKGSASAPLRAWSAACASGEEAYSLTVALRRQLGLEAPALEVWGTDINQAALDSANAADYGKWSFRPSAVEMAAPDAVVEAARTELLRQQVLDPLTRACVKFARHNLLDPPRFDGLAGPRFHVIFCRNALVYFQSRAADQAIRHLVASLVPGGWLIMGNMDIAHCPEGMHQVGSARLCVFERLAKDLPAAPEKRPAPMAAFKRPQPAKAQAPERELEMAVDWHRGIMAQLELGRVDAAILELQALVEAFPQYLPGWFEQGLALSRHGFNELAARSLSRVLKLARDRDPSALIPGPEALSLDFYVSNAEAFLNSQGEDLP